MFNKVNHITFILLKSWLIENIDNINTDYKKINFIKTDSTLNVNKKSPDKMLIKTRLTRLTRSIKQNYLLQIVYLWWFIIFLSNKNYIKLIF